MYVFTNCNGLRSAAIEYGVTSIGTGAFDYCTNLTSVTVPGSVTNIGAYAFNHCASLTNVNIPKSVSTIKSGAFWSCVNLTGIYFAGNAPNVPTGPPGAPTSAFYLDQYAIAFYLPGTVGWGNFFFYGGLPAVLWNPLIQTSGTNFGTQGTQFGFNITGTPNIPIVVEACTDLANPLWSPLQTLTLTNGLVYFSEPLEVGYAARYYRISAP